MKTKTLLAAGILALTATVHADTFGSGGNTFSMSFVPIGNAGNANDTVTASDSSGKFFGGVSYTYKMSVTDVSQTMLALATANGVPNLGGGAWTGNRPAANVAWYQAAEFVNFLNTSTGHVAAYSLNYNIFNQQIGINLWSAGQAWTAGGLNQFRNKDAVYFLPSENEWYKAAYYNGTSYNQYATLNGLIPTGVASGTAPNTAVCDGVGSQPAAVDQSGGLSPYGTQGQTGNVDQWMESNVSGTNDTPSGNRTIRGRVWNTTAVTLQSSTRAFNDPRVATTGIGFRVASVPEPSCMLLMASAGMVVLSKRRRRPTL